MADTVIIPQKELNYIETLYLYANLEDFIKPVGLEELDPKGKYIMMMKWVYDNILIHARMLSSTDSVTIYKLPNYRLLIREYDVAKKSNTFNIEIQYEWEHLFNCRNDITLLELPFDGTHDQYHIKRIDITKIAKHKEDYLTGTKFISSYRKIHREGTEDKTETVYLGNRANGNVIRMYDKTKELRDRMNHRKIELLGDYFGDIDNLYTYEVELHRKALRTAFGMTRLSDVSKANELYNNIFGKIRIYEDTPKNDKLKKQRKRERISAYTIGNYVQYDRLPRKKYKASRKNAVKRCAKILRDMMEAVLEEVTLGNVVSLLGELLVEMINSPLENYTIEVTPTQLSEELDEMKIKHERLRDGNDQLSTESTRAFKSYPYQGNGRGEKDIRKLPEKLQGGSENERNGTLF